MDDKPLNKSIYAEPIQHSDAHSRYETINKNTNGEPK